MTIQTVPLSHIWYTTYITTHDESRSADSANSSLHPEQRTVTTVCIDGFPSRRQTSNN